MLAVVQPQGVCFHGYVCRVAMQPARRIVKPFMPVCSNATAVRALSSSKAGMAKEIEC